jgi:hypothetical protein
MADEAELEIKIIPDEEANVEAAQAADEKVTKKAEITTEVKDPAMQELMAQYKDLEGREAEKDRRLAEAEREKERLRVEAEGAKKQVANSHLDTVTTALNSAKSDAEQAKRDIRVAKDAGDIDAEIEAQDRLAQARADERRLDEARSDLEARAKAPPKRQAPPTDPVEAYVQGRTAPTASWLRAHPEFITDTRKQAKLTAAHYDAEGDGLVADTPAYFAHVEKFLGIGGEAVTKAAPTEAAQVEPAKQRKGAPVAPGSAVSNNGAGSGATPVMLTRGEAAAAQDGTHVWNYDDPKGKFKKNDPIGIQEFARRKVAMQKQGLYDKSYSEV